MLLFLTKVTSKKTFKVGQYRTLPAITTQFTKYVLLEDPVLERPLQLKKSKKFLLIRDIEFLLYLRFLQ
jgi:hypothetical protein